MPTLREILADPNYINANPATKEAIFNKYAPLDSNYTQANEATQEAIRQRFGLDVGGFGFTETPPAIPEDQTTKNPFAGMVGRAAELAGSGLGAVAEVAERVADKLETAIPLSNIPEDQIKSKKQLQPLFDWPGPAPLPDPMR